MADDQLISALGYARKQIDHHRAQIDHENFRLKKPESQERVENICRYWQKLLVNDIAYLIQTARLESVLGKEGIERKMEEMQKVINPFLLVGTEPDTTPRD